MLLTTQSKTALQVLAGILMFANVAAPQIPVASRPLAGDTDAYLAASSITTIQGSTPIHRSQTDRSTGLVMIYVGGSLPAGTNLVSFQYLFDQTTAGNTTGFITPLLFEYKPGEAFTTFTVRGIGKGVAVKLSSSPQTIPFTILEGVRMSYNDLFTFGFVNALVDAKGVPKLTSRGVVDFDVPADGGEGVGGTGTTNNWAVTNSYSPSPVVTLGTTFGSTGANVDYTFLLPYRTYSAQAIGIVPPNRGLTLNGSASLLTGPFGYSVIALTPAQSGQAGTAFTTQRVAFDPKYAFRTFFQFQMTNPGGEPGGGSDGMTFLLQTESATALGANGGNLGYLGITPSVAVEFDTYQNPWDINDNHVAILTNGQMDDLDPQTPYGVTNCQPTRGVFGCMNNGDVWSVWIDYDGTNLNVALADNSATRPPNLISYPIDIPGILGQNSAFVGFTAGTGDGWENHYVLDWWFF